MSRSDQTPAMRARPSTILSVAGGPATAALGPAFVWRFALRLDDTARAFPGRVTPAAH